MFRRASWRAALTTTGLAPIPSPCGLVAAHGWGDSSDVAPSGRVGAGYLSGMPWSDQPQSSVGKNACVAESAMPPESWGSQDDQKRALTQPVAAQRT